MKRSFWISTLLLFGVKICYSTSKAASHAEDVEILSDKQKEAITLFRPFVLETAHQEYMKRDSYLGRWLQAYDFDVNATKARFRDSQTWRTEKNIDSIVGEAFPISIKDNFPITISSFDKYGRPVGFMPAGKYNMRKMVVKGQVEIMLRFGIMMLELMEIYLNELQCNGNLSSSIQPQIIAVIDLSGASMLNFACYNCLLEAPGFISTFDNHYPEIMHRAILINVPRLLVAILVSLKSLMSAKSQEAVHIYGFEKAEWTTVLLDLIAFDQLPVQYGGGKNMTQNTGNSRTTWNWDNPTLGNIIHQYRQNSATSTERNCVEDNSVFSSISNADITTDNKISAPELSVSTDVPIEHRHRHFHGLHHRRQNGDSSAVSNTLENTEFKSESTWKESARIPKPDNIEDFNSILEDTLTPEDNYPDLTDSVTTEENSEVFSSNISTEESSIAEAEEAHEISSNSSNIDSIDNNTSGYAKTEVHLTFMTFCIMLASGNGYV